MAFDADVTLETLKSRLLSIEAFVQKLDTDTLRDIMTICKPMVVRQTLCFLAII